MGFEPGYVITVKKDTLWGEVKNYNQATHSVAQIRFRGEGGNKTYDADQLLAFGRGTEDYVAGREPGSLNFFVKVEAEGYLSLFSSFVSGGPSGYGYIPAKTTYYLIREGEKEFQKVPEMGFRKTLLAYLKDAPILCKEIEDKTLGKKDVEEIVKRYNRELGKTTRFWGDIE
jgi:hypothetical protein